MKKILSVILSCIICGGMFSVPVLANDEKITLYVSLSGNDENPGSVDAPLKTLNGAKEKLREIRGEDTSKGAEIIFREGTYVIDSTVNFEELDSGSEDAEVVIRSEEGEEVNFKGSMEIDETMGVPVSDEKIRERLYPDVRDKIIEIDLLSQGFPYQVEKTDKVRYSYQLFGENSYKEYLNLYLNGVEQPLAEWPNGDDSYVSYVEAIEKGDSQGGAVGGSFRYAEDNPDRWKNVENAWTAGYLSKDFRFERNSISYVDPVNNIIKLATASAGGVGSAESRRWKAFNILEEIDVPGEWYVDRSTMKLYYYPEYSLSGAKLEISFLQKEMIHFENAKFITVSGINFSQSRSIGIKMTDVSDITVTNCKFTDLDGGGIIMLGSKMAETDKHWWQRQQSDAAYNCEISNNIFYNIGGHVIKLNGGNVDTLEKGNNKFVNNFLSNISTKHKGAVAVNLGGCGNVMSNNNISGGSFHATTYYGNDHEIQYNEIYNMNKCTDDVGTIYTGRNYISRGTVTAYNYLHDLNPVKQTSRGFNLAIYWDDSACGQYAHHNIIVNSNLPIYSCGHMNYYKDNIMVNTREGMNFNNNYATPSRIATWQTSVANILNKELYFERYKNFELGATDKWAQLNAFSEVTGNLNVKSGEVTLSSHTVDYGKVENNIKLDECSDFVNPDKQDYRIKSDSETAKSLPGLLTEEFDIEAIGTNQEIVLNSKTAPFRQYYPKNGTKGVGSTDLTLNWEKAMGANRFRVVIAKDPELKNVVYDEEVHYNYYTVPYLDAGETYYWKVYAKNISREFGSEWESNGAPYMFTTALYNEVDTTKLFEEIERAEGQLEKIVESGENGDFPEGTKDEFVKVINEAKRIANGKIGEITKKQVDEKLSELAGFLDSKRINRPGFINLGKYIFDEEAWTVKDFSIENDTVKIQSSHNYGGLESVKNVTDEGILCFRAKIDTAGWVGLGIASNPEVAMYGPGSMSYFFAIKDTFIELQKNPGSKSVILTTKDIKVANDGKFHDYQMGVIKLGAGNLVLLKIDGETVFEWLDTEDNAVATKNLSLCVHNTKNGVSFMAADSLPDHAEYEELVKKYKLEAAKACYERFTDAENLVMMKIGENAVVSPENFEIKSDVAPEIVNNKTLVPLRLVSEIFGAEVKWENNTAIIEKDGKVMEFKPDETTYTLNGESIKMEQAAIIRNNRILVPVRDISEGLEKEVLWDSPNELILIGDVIGIVQMNSKELLKRSAETIQMLGEM